jgi:hypothetical protein
MSRGGDERARALVAEYREVHSDFYEGLHGCGRGREAVMGAARDRFYDCDRELCGTDLEGVGHGRGLCGLCSD